MDPTWKSLYEKVKAIENDPYGVAKLALVTSELIDNRFPPQSAEDMELLLDQLCGNTTTSKLLPEVYKVLSPYIVDDMQIVN